MSEKRENDKSGFGEDLSRRDFLRWVGIAGATVGVGGVSGVLAGCGSDDATTTTAAAAGGATTTAPASGTTAAPTKTGREIKIGYVTPTTGALAGFAEADPFILEGVKAATANGLVIGDTTYPINIIVKDSQSSPDRAATVAGDLITGDQIDLMVVGWTPETTNPVSDQCEANGVPCVSTVDAVAAVVLRPQGRPGQGLRVDLPLLLGPRGHHRRLRRHVGHGPDQQGRGRPLAQRRRRQRLGRPQDRLPARP